MTKSQMVDRVAEATGLTKIETEAVIDGFLYLVQETLKEGEAVELRGFGAFRPKERAPRVARNPQTNEQVTIPRRWVPAFKASREFRKAVNAARIADEG